MNISDDKLIEDINSLPKEQKEVMILHYNKDLDFDEISQILDITETEVSEIHQKAFGTICDSVLKRHQFA